MVLVCFGSIVFGFLLNLLLGLHVDALHISALLEASIFAHSCSGSGSTSRGVIGFKPYTASNGHICMVEWTARLYADVGYFNDAK